MKAFKDKVAVITGGASGLGLALAEEAQARGCRLVIGDIRPDALHDAQAKLSQGGEVLACEVDVSSEEQMERFAAHAVERFGAVNLLFNNAGVFASGVCWETSAKEYDWVIGVNQRSVLHGIRAFVPRMIAQGDECHVVTVSSGAGLTVNAGFASYSMTKHAAVAITEALYLDLATQGIDNIGVTLAMPGMSQSGIMSPEKTTPGSLKQSVEGRKSNPVLNAIEGMMATNVARGLPANELAHQVFEAISEDALYVLPAFDDDMNRGFATAVGTGRANAQNPYPPLINAVRASVKEAGE